jgi:hypothetical protein
VSLSENDTHLTHFVCSEVSFECVGSGVLLSSELPSEALYAVFWRFSVGEVSLFWSPLCEIRFPPVSIVHNSKRLSKIILASPFKFKCSECCID